MISAAAYVIGQFQQAIKKPSGNLRAYNDDFGLPQASQCLLLTITSQMLII